MSAADQLLNQAASQPSPAAPAPGPVPSGTSSAEASDRDTRYARTKAALAEQPKERIRVTRNTFVQINGVGTKIQAGHSVSVPRQVAEILIEAGRA